MLKGSNIANYVWQKKLKITLDITPAGRRHLHLMFDHIDTKMRHLNFQCKFDISSVASIFYILLGNTVTLCRCCTGKYYFVAFRRKIDKFI